MPDNFAGVVQLLQASNLPHRALEARVRGERDVSSLKWLALTATLGCLDLKTARKEKWNGSNASGPHCREPLHAWIACKYADDGDLAGWWERFPSQGGSSCGCPRDT